MKKVIFILAFILIGTYANASTENPIIDNTKTEFVKSYVFNGLSAITKTVIEADICTITVTYTTSDGVRHSATASNNRGDCGKAQHLADAVALKMAEDWIK
ncbi:hypothetical protein [Tenacibaculum soleae]|uniref:hypothetical protein n=1 Tax=Tenacibaculum soleae TaxID=447689 RepID=UPI0026E2DE76|nr:hypothetical protein [Tenacibaculum soleae]MDO6812634.1 hypothetical protein [Tenacibaculum soleae]